MDWQTTDWGGQKETETHSDKVEVRMDTGSHRRHFMCVELSDKYLYRRAFSELTLLDTLPDLLQDGKSIHCITGGDVDSLSYLKCVLRVQKLHYCLLSTWCMGAQDIYEISEWIKNGTIEKMDFYVGEIFPNQYRVEWQMLQDLIRETNCGRVACFRNHSKIYAGYGDKFHFAIETSANVNTNPRTEQGVITQGKEIYDFYKSYFDGIKSIIKDE